MISAGGCRSSMRRTCPRTGRCSTSSGRWPLTRVSRPQNSRSPGSCIRVTPSYPFPAYARSGASKRMREPRRSHCQPKTLRRSNGRRRNPQPALGAWIPGRQVLFRVRAAYRNALRASACALTGHGCPRYVLMSGCSCCSSVTPFEASSSIPITAQ